MAASNGGYECVSGKGSVFDDDIEMVIDGKTVAVTLRDIEKANACISEEL